MIEQRELWRVSEKFVFQQYRSVYLSIPAQWLSIQNFDKTYDFHKKFVIEKENFGIYDLRTGKCLVRPSNGKLKHQFGYDDSKFVNLETNSCKNLNKNKLCNYILLVGDSTELMNSGPLYLSVKNVDVDELAMPSITLIQVVPGCGKTHHILENVDPGSDLVLFPTREGREDFVKRFQAGNPTVGKRLVREDFRTIDSFLMHPNGKVYSRVLVDEALMLHAGQIMFAVAAARASSLLLIGDTRQIPFINRIRQCQVKFSSVRKYCTNVKQLKTSFRCTNTVACLLSPVYEDGMKSTSSVRAEMSTVRYTNPNCIERIVGAKYLVFKQSEKLDLLRLGYDVSTVHEYQGKQSDVVVVVRTTSKKEEIYNKPEHCLVAISRHKKRFIYYTPVFDDGISKYVKRSAGLLDSDYKACHVDLRGGGAVKSDFTVPVYSLAYTNVGYLHHPSVYSVCDRWGYTAKQVQTCVLVGAADYSACSSVSDVPFLPQNCGSSVDVLQEFYDYVLPGNSVHFLDYDVYNVNTLFPLEVHLENITFDSSRTRVYKPQQFDKLKPVLRTSIGDSRPSTQIETLLAMIKRNLNVPDIQGQVFEEEMIDLMFSKFVSTFIPSHHMSIFDEFSSSPLVPNATSLTQWLHKQKPEVLGQIDVDVPLHERHLNFYNFMLKSTVKPQLDINAPYVYSSLQTIAYHDKDINAYFCPIFNEIKNRLTSVIEPRSATI